ncbi:E-selectin-like isoform X2 [Macrobrachium nipponense]|uniref:E-selectin-like isoform X2 n=1 Tax=Macrobrachium nipponense TaxID=159736 RepID=UPI0030C81474
MALSNGSTTWNSTCSVNSTTVPPTYYFSPNPMPGCIACTRNVSVDFSTTNWAYGNTYTVGTFVNITCNSGYIVNQEGFVNSTSVTCTSWGWDPYVANIDCKKACYAMPPTPNVGSNIQMPDVKRHYEGTTYYYTCNSGYYVPAFSPALRNTVSVSCSSQGNWDLEMQNVSVLYCAEMCANDPVTPPGGGSDWDRVSRAVGTKVNLTCPEGFAFPDLNRSIILTCVTGGNWTQQNTPPIEATCKMITYAQPTAPLNSILNTTAPPPYWQGSVLNYTCPNNYMSSTGSTWTSLTFTGPNWTYADPTFRCIQACGSPPPAVNPVTLTFSGVGVEGDTATYKCPVGFEGHQLQDLFVNCKSGSWTYTTIPKCKMCNSTLPSAPQGVSVTSYDGVPAYGAVATHSCQGLFPDGASAINVTCDQGVWNPQEIPECATPCLGAPLNTLPVGVTSIRSNVSLFEAVVTYTCAGAFLDKTTQINVTCNEGVWSPPDIPFCDTRLASVAR